MIDALACWPSHPTTGYRPSYIALNGGWFNGTWTHALYRALSCPVGLRYWPEAVGAEVIVAGFPDDTPVAWEFIEPPATLPLSSVEVGSWPAEHGRVEHLLETLKRIRPHLQSRDGVRTIVALPPDLALGPGHTRAHAGVRLLYADQDLVTDCLHMQIDSHPTRPPNWLATFDNRPAFAAMRRGDATPIPWTRTITPVVRALGEARCVPDPIARRLARAVIDVRLAYPDLGADFAPSHAGAAAAVPSKLPGTVQVPWSVGRVGVLCGLEAGLSLAEPLNGGRNPLAYMFDEEDDGVLRTSSPVSTNGHWTFDPEGPCLINQSSGQRLRYLGEETLGDLGPPRPLAAGGRVWRFRYEDEAAQYPLIVRSEVRTRPHGLFYHWQVDHGASAVVWRQEESEGSDNPSYGLWRRVDSCALDALLGWPELESTGPAPLAIDAVGGWTNAAWEPHLRRTCYSGYDWGFGPDAGIDAPYVEALDAQPRRWHFVDVSTGVGLADLAFVEEIESHRFHLPADQPLTGFEADTPYLRRDDGRAIMFPAGCRIWRSHHDWATALFLYVDEEVFFYLAARRTGGSIYVNWSILPQNRAVSGDVIRECGGFVVGVAP